MLKQLFRVLSIVIRPLDRQAPGTSTSASVWFQDHRLFPETGDQDKSKQRMNDILNIEFMLLTEWRSIARSIRPLVVLSWRRFPWTLAKNGSFRTISRCPNSVAWLRLEQLACVGSWRIFRIPVPSFSACIVRVELGRLAASWRLGQENLSVSQGCPTHAKCRRKIALQAAKCYFTLPPNFAVMTWILTH